MACRQPTSHDSCQTETASRTPANNIRRKFLTETLFRQLPGTWNLNRSLQSTTVSEPTGKCVGAATFTRREPSVFVNKDGKLEMASLELVYHEHGHFETQHSSPHGSSLRYPFSRKYVWRYRPEDGDHQPKFSIWFTKPGSEVIDYLFHHVNVTMVETGDDGSTAIHTRLQAEGCHLCEDDLYSSSYTFEFNADNNALKAMESSANLAGWNMLHEVRGPNKDQVIETNFSQP